METTESVEGHERSSWGKIASVSVLLTLLITVFLLAFALPSINAEPQDVPVAVVGTEETTRALTTGLENSMPGGFDITVASDAREARELIRDRAVYGAFVVDGPQLTVLTASAASATVATTLSTVGEQFGSGLGLSITTEDVVPFSDDDPRGVSLSAGALPIALGGWIAAVGIIATVRGNRERLYAAGIFSVIGGFALAAVLQFWLGTFTGNYLLTALAATLGMAATSFLVLGLQRLLGIAGIAVAAILLILLGNPLSGLSSAPEFLPAPWGAIGQLLPPGATGTLLRNVAFFDGSATLTPIIVLGFWALAGLGMYLLAVSRSNQDAPTQPDTELKGEMH